MKVPALIKTLMGIGVLATAILVNQMPVQAQWALDHYEVEKYGVIDNRSRQGQQPEQGTPAGYQFVDPWADPQMGEKPQKYKVTVPASQDGAANSVHIHSALRYLGSQTTMSGGQAPFTMAVTPIFRWTGTGELPKIVYYQELCGLYTIAHHSEYNPYQGNSFSLELKNPWDQEWENYTTQGTNRSSGSNIWHLSQVKASSNEVRGKSRTFSGKISASGISFTGYESSAEAEVGVTYQAAIIPFGIGVSTNSVGLLKNQPTDKELEAYAAKNFTGIANPAAPIEFFWDGKAGYTAQTEGIQGLLGNMTYKWETDKQTVSNAQIQNGGNGSGPAPTEYDPTEYPNPSQPPNNTPNKNFHHKLGTTKRFEPTSTTTSVEVTGDNPATEIIPLKAKAKINWYQNPETKLRSETYVIVYDYDKGTINKYGSLSEALGGSSEEAQIDEYIGEIEGAYKETLETGITAVSTALEIEMAVGSWYVPDEIDIGTVVVGGVAKRVFRIGRSVFRFGDLAAKIGTKLNSKGGRVLAALRTKLGSTNIIVEVRQKLIAESRIGHLPNDGIRSNEKLGELEDVSVCRWGESCFVAGTPILLADGTFLPIEQIKTGDLVLAKDPATGQVSKKRVGQKFERQSPATLILSFSNGEHIETTKEHPFYVEGKGFVPAGEIGLGTSIVTRAGPPIQLVKSEHNNGLQTVYNFEVEDFHTYFVGSSTLWVHNSCSHELNLAASQKADEAFYGRTPGADGKMPPAPETANAIKPPGNNPIFTGTSKKGRADWDPHPFVEKLYDAVPAGQRNRRGHGNCAEVDTLSKIFDHLGFSRQGNYTGNDFATSLAQARELLQGGKSWAVYCGSKKHGLARHACDSCRHVLEEQLGMIDEVLRLLGPPI